MDKRAKKPARDITSFDGPDDVLAYYADDPLEAIEVLIDIYIARHPGCERNEAENRIHDHLEYRETVAKLRKQGLYHDDESANAAANAILDTQLLDALMEGKFPGGKVKAIF